MRIESDIFGKKRISNHKDGSNRYHFQYDSRSVDRFRVKLRAQNEAKLHKLGEMELALQLRNFGTGMRNLFAEIDATSIQSIQTFHCTSNLPKLFKTLSDHINETATKMCLDCESNSKPSILIRPLLAADFDCNGLEWDPFLSPKAPNSLTIGLCFSQMIVPTLYPTTRETPYSALILGNDDIWIPQNSQLWSLIRK